MSPFLLLSLALCAGERPTLEYSAATVVHSATGEPLLAPNTFASIYGRDLAYVTRALEPTDIAAGLLPILLPGTGLRVLVEGLAAPLWYVSPTQINFLIPGELLPKPQVKVWVALDGKSGPEVLIRVVAVAPGLFALDPSTALATALDGSVLKMEAPARPGQDVVLYATGLGPTIPETGYRQIARSAAPLARMAEFRVLLNAVPVPPSRIRYAGAAPSYAGLYQINLWLPDDTAPNPEVRIAIGESVSPPGLLLPVR